ncbi:MAG: hypothetical protein AAF236_10630 [Verrucomicrobiota bacterium]
MKKNRCLATLTSSNSQASAFTETSKVRVDPPVTDEPAVVSLRYGRRLLNLAREIAGALLRFHAEGRCPKETRVIVAAALVEQLKCRRFEAERMIDLALEVIHLQAKGSFQRNTLELSYLIAQATGQVREVEAN